MKDIVLINLVFFFQTIITLPFETCNEVPERGGRGCGGGLVLVDGTVVWGGGGEGVYQLDEVEKRWNKLTDCTTWATLGVCSGRLVSVGGDVPPAYSDEVMVWKGGEWTCMPGMVTACRQSCVVAVDGGGLLVMGGEGCRIKALDTIQVFDSTTQTWHIGPPLPQPCKNMSAAVYGDLVFVMGGWPMDRAVWCANISDLVSNIPCQSGSPLNDIILQYNVIYMLWVCPYTCLHVAMCSGT